MEININKPQNPAMLDIAFEEINSILKNNLDWLTNAFGRIQRITKNNEYNKRITFPAIYSGPGNNYEDLTPVDRLGNYSFIEVDDPTEIETIPNQYHIIKAKINIVFWLNLNRITEPDNRNIEKIKMQILDVFTNNNTRSCRVTITEIYERFENVYSRYTISNGLANYSMNEATEQYMQHPYTAFKFKANIRYERLC